ncbi:hypothetical protein BsWGS_15492 [Bradybaena similaris]
MYFQQQKGWGFSARARVRIGAEKSDAYQTTTSNMRTETKAAAATNAPVTREMFVPHFSLCYDSYRVVGCLTIRSPYVVPPNVQELVWIYCPGHASIRNIERADSLASEAPITADVDDG